jgi:aspartate-semialdehyde dehydrogenase
VLAERHFPIGQLRLLASARSAGKTITFAGKTYTVETLTHDSFKGIDIALFSAGGSISKEFAPSAVKAGAIVVDNSSAFRMTDGVPLVVPEVNPEAIKTHKGIIANPNCSTIQMLVALKPLHDAAGITRINVATYQSVSGEGKEAVDELAHQTGELLNGRPAEAKVIAKQIAFNCVPQIDKFMDNGYTKEEMKMVWETRKIMGDPSILVNATAVRVPVFFGHSEAVHIETRQKITADAARDLLRRAPGIEVLDERKPGGYPTAATEAANRDTVYVGRIREDISHERGLNLWIVSDNIRKGAATNSVQIAEILVREHI